MCKVDCSYDIPLVSCLKPYFTLTASHDFESKDSEDVSRPLTTLVRLVRISKPVLFVHIAISNFQVCLACSLHLLHKRFIPAKSCDMMPPKSQTSGQRDLRNTKSKFLGRENWAETVERISAKVHACLLATLLECKATSVRRKREDRGTPLRITRLSFIGLSLLWPEAWISHASMQRSCNKHNRIRVTTRPLESHHLPWSLHKTRKSAFERDVFISRLNLLWDGHQARL